MFTGEIGFSQTRISAEDAAAIAAKQDQKFVEAVEQKRKNIRAFASIHIRPKRHTKSNIPPLSERYFGKRSSGQ